MKVLGLSALHEDAAAALVVDGAPVAAEREEAFSRTPGDASLPLRAARACLARAGLTGPELDGVVFYEKPLRRFERSLLGGLRRFPRGAGGFARTLARWLGDRLWVRGRLAEELGVPHERLSFLDHALSHAACAFHLSPFDEAAVLVLDDVGEWTTTAVGRGSGAALELLLEAHLPHSLGLAASAFTQFLGLEPGADDPRLVDLAAHGEPRFRDAVAELVGVDGDGCPRLMSGAFRFGEGDGRLGTGALDARFGAPREPGEPLRLGAADGRGGGDAARDADLAASVQAVLEERALALAALARERTGLARLAVAGALARNRGVVAALVARAPFDDVYVPPAPDEAGAALGAALHGHALASGEPCRGGSASLALGEAPLDEGEAGEAAAERAEGLAALLAAGTPVGWMRGPVELGAEATTARLALGDPRPADARARLLGALQHHERYLGCRLLLPRERVGDYVEAPDGNARALALGQVLAPARAALAQRAPDAVAPDGRVWVQAVDGDAHPELARLLAACGERAGLPALLAAPLRLRGGVVPRFEREALELLGRSRLAALWCEGRLHRGEAEVAA